MFNQPPMMPATFGASNVELLTIVNSAATIVTIIAALLVASNYSPKVMVAGFATFVAASLLWITSGVVDDKSSLVIQNAVLLAINGFGIWRWLPRA